MQHNTVWSNSSCGKLWICLILKMQLSMNFCSTNCPYFVEHQSQSDKKWPNSYQRMLVIWSHLKQLLGFHFCTTNCPQCKSELSRGRFVEVKLMLVSNFRCDKIHNGHKYDFGHTLLCHTQVRLRCSTNPPQDKLRPGANVIKLFAAVSCDFSY